MDDEYFLRCYEGVEIFMIPNRKFGMSFISKLVLLRANEIVETWNIFWDKNNS